MLEKMRLRWFTELMCARRKKARWLVAERASVGDQTSQRVLRFSSSLSRNDGAWANVKCAQLWIDEQHVVARTDVEFQSALRTRIEFEANRVLATRGEITICFVSFFVAPCGGQSRTQGN